MRRPSSRSSRLGLALAGALSALAVTGSVSTAAAHSWYPGWIQEHFAVGCAPQCTLCHTNPQGGQDYLKGSEVYVDGTKPSHRGYGVFVSNFYESLPKTWPDSKGQVAFEAKLKALQTQACQTDVAKGDISDTAACDSDGDGTSDYAELALGNDPDTVGAGPECPKYGCGASIGSLPHDADKSGRAGAVMAALGVMLVLARRFRR
jgi:hypothetical protein